MDTGAYTGVVFLDLKKAFDTVDHHILLKKLAKYGANEKSLKWFESYLLDRYQYTMVQGVKSSTKCLACGVPQGSILGPLLFIVYINDLPSFMEQCRVSLYADDTAMYFASRSQVDLMLTLRLELSIVAEWLKANHLTLNVPKTKFVIFATRPKLNNFEEQSLFINGSPIERVSCMKYLGLLLDEVLSFNEHVDYLHNTISACTGLLYHSLKLLDLKTSLTLHKSLVLPHFDYGDTVYSATSQHNLDRLQKLQNSACRSILLLNREAHIFEMHNELNLPYLSDRRYLHYATDCHKAVHQSDAYCMSKFMIPVGQVMPRTTRSGQQQVVRVPRRRTNLGQRGYSYRGRFFWNSIPSDIRSEQNLLHFKSLVVQARGPPYTRLDNNYPT